jgi:hypothetical protein
MKRKLNTGINFSGMTVKVCLKKTLHFQGIFLQYQVNGIW